MMTVDLYDQGVNLILHYSFRVALMIFLIYAIGMLIHFVKGNDFNTTDHFNPFINNHIGTVIAVPVMFMGISGLVALTWPISIPVLTILSCALPFRIKNLRKKKLWETLRSK